MSSLLSFLDLLENKEIKNVERPRFRTEVHADCKNAHIVAWQ